MPKSLKNGDKIDVGGAFFTKFKEDFGKPSSIDCSACFSKSDIMVLTVDAAEGRQDFACPSSTIPETMKLWTH